jgi:hypothetical protein
MHTISKLLFVSLLGLGCASAQVGRNPVADLRGNVAVSGQSVKAVVAGPADLHAYAAFKGGQMYTASAVAGRDGDCAAAHTNARALEADRITVMHVEAGQVACLATPNGRGFELLWHAHVPETEAITVAAASETRGDAK